MSYKNQNKEKVYEELEKLLEEKKKLSKYFTITVKDYLKVSKGYLKNFVGYKVGVEFPEKEVDLEPYALGYWLGDGTSTQPQITTAEHEVVDYFKEYVEKLGLELKQGNNTEHDKGEYRYTIKTKTKKNINKENIFYNYLKNLNLINNKHIPHIYKCNSRKNQLKLLAGLIDSDGYYDKKGKCYEITQKNSKLSEDIVYLCRSLGFACYSKKCKKSCMYKGETREGEYNRMYIFGNGLEEIPVLCIRKEAEVRKQIKDALCSQISVKCIGRDKYYGFELDGNRKYLLGNFIVTHNTTLSADPKRKLIGDDEHCWTDNGIFNIEGGCYAKCIKLRQDKEPEIWDAIRFGSILENVIVNKYTREVDFYDDSITENTRCSYPIDYIKNVQIPCVGNHPTNIIFLTCDAFGVLPAVSKLTLEQAMYYFISGYTAKIAGTEVGITEPTATFSACFGGAFLVWHPLKYAELLQEKLKKYSCQAWLINTGWYGGSYGSGERFPLPITRKIIDTIHNDNLTNIEYETLPIFNLEIPTRFSDINNKYLNPQISWNNKDLYNQKLKHLSKLFKENYKKYRVKGDEKVFKSGPE